MPKTGPYVKNCPNKIKYAQGHLEHDIKKSRKIGAENV